mgnify:CR=1 FL=1
MSFAHLHVHTEYSLLDGSNKIKEYVARVKELGMNSAAITDHGVMFGVIDFYKAAKAAGINVPIIPGIKPFKKLSQLSMVPKTFKVDLPEDLVKEVLKCKNDKEAEQVGIEWCVAQCKELMAHGVPSIHFYSIGAVDSIKEVAKIIY